MSFIPPKIEHIADAALAAALQAKIDTKTKPVGALGRLEALALQIGLIQRTTTPALLSPQILVCAADHGLAAQGVSAYPSEVNAQMVANMLSGGAAVNVFARRAGLALSLANVGVAGQIPKVQRAADVNYIDLPFASGTADSSKQAAMTMEQCGEALQRGAALGRELPGNVIALGEMGIGNSSAAALLLSALEGVPIDQAVGRGTGLSDAGLAHKTAVLQTVLQRHKHAINSGNCQEVLQAIGGLEIAMMAGAMLGAASVRKVVVIDGFIAGSAALAAKHLSPAVLDYCVFAHQSAESGAQHMLQALNAKPLLNLDLRLGEGSGALLAYPLLEAACDFLALMASFESAGVSTAASEGLA